MARTIEEIYNEMATEKNNFSVLNQLQPNIDDFQSMLTQLSTTSKVAIWRLMIYIVAVGIWALEKSFDLHKAWIINRALEIQTGTVFWYASKCLDFQYGDAIQWNGSNYQYPTINEAIKIVKLVSVREVGTKVVIKVANLIGSNAVPLTIGELTAVETISNTSIK